MATTASSYTLHANDSVTSKVVSALVSYLGLDAKHVQESGNEFPVLHTPTGAKLTGLDAARHVASEKNSALLGTSDEGKKEVDTWIEWALKEFVSFDKEKDEAKLEKLNQVLVDRVFLVSNRLSLADIAVYAAVAPVMGGLDERSQHRFFALVRWFDYLQHYDLKITAAVSGGSVVHFDLNAPFKAHHASGAAASKGSAAGADQTKRTDIAKEKETEPVASSSIGQEGKDTKGGQQKQQQQPKEKSKLVPAAAEGQEGGKGKQKQAAAEAGATKGKQPKGGSSSKPKPKPAEKADITRLDIRVGVIRSVTKHPKAQNLYVEQIDLGEEAPRQVVSGLVKFIPESDMMGARVICLCNLKPAKLVEVMSHAMVLCAGNSDHTQVELITPPEGAKVGERIIIEGFEGEPDARLPPKRDVFAAVKPSLHVRDDLVPCFKAPSGADIPFMTSAGPCKVKSLVGGSIS